MTTTNVLNAAESWEKVYQAFGAVNFTAYDFSSVKRSLIDYLKFYYPENFNDYTESSSLIALIELFAYVAELMAYRTDLSAHENQHLTASRKQSILRLVSLVSYRASRNLPLRGLVKVTGVSVSENLNDTQGNTLTNRVIRWNDPANPLWKEQFFTVIGRVLNQKFGSPLKSFQVDDVVFQQYELNNLIEAEDFGTTFKNGVSKLKVLAGGDTLDFELVPSDVDSAGVLEREPNPNLRFAVLYGDDGFGDGSDTTGFLMFLKQGALNKLTYVFDTPLPNRTLDVNLNNVNDLDVWVQKINDQGYITETWTPVERVAGTNVIFNSTVSPLKYEVETMEDDKIRLLFGDGDFAEIPQGVFNIWARTSTSGVSVVQKADVSGQTVTFSYTSRTGRRESCTLTYALTASLQNSAPAEDIEHIRQAAPAFYYAQNRMVNGEDYNSFPLQDPSILKLKAVNRTFAGQPKYIPWNDASGEYQNVKLFGDDLRLYHEIRTTVEVASLSARDLIDNLLEPILGRSEVKNLLIYAFFTKGSPWDKPYLFPRTRFIEDLDQEIGGLPLQEKTMIQGALDRHWYGEPDETILLDVALSATSSNPKTVYGVVNGDTDARIYDSNLRMVLRDPDTGIFTLVPTPGAVSGIQETAIQQQRFGIAFEPDRSFSSALRINPADTDPDAILGTDTLTATDLNQGAVRASTYTIEIVDSEGNFSVYNSVSGQRDPGVIGEPYDDGAISFIIGFPPSSDETVVPGDAFVVTVTLSGSSYSPSIVKLNLTGYFYLINEIDLTSDTESLPYDVTLPNQSWVILVERVDNAEGFPSYWRVVTRSFSSVAQSETTNFWFNQNTLLIDSETQLPVRDVVKILKSNMNGARTAPLGIDRSTEVIDAFRYGDGAVDPSALRVTPGAGTAYDLIRFITPTDYVYFRVDAATGRLIPIPTTVYLQSLTYDLVGVSGSYVRKNGRDLLDFMWQHFTPRENLIDPTPTNIIDVYVLTRGFYVALQNFLKGQTELEPTPPTPLELRNTYRKLTQSKMISDTVVFHPARLKYLFGTLAVPELRAVIRAVPAPTARLTGDQIRSRILTLINEYFQLQNWDLGQSFYASELLAFIHLKLSTEILSVVLVPRYPLNYFGDLMFISCAPDELFVSAAQLEDVELIQGIDRLNLKQK